MEENDSLQDNPMNLAGIRTETSQGVTEEAAGSKSEIASQLLSSMNVDNSDSRLRESRTGK